MAPWESGPAAVQGIMNIPAIVILAILSALLIRGTRESAFVNSIIVIIKVAIVLMVIASAGASSTRPITRRSSRRRCLTRRPRASRTHTAA